MKAAISLETRDEPGVTASQPGHAPGTPRPGPWTPRGTLPRDSPTCRCSGRRGRSRGPRNDCGGARLSTPRLPPPP